MLKMATAAALMATIGAGALATHAFGQTPDRAGLTGESHPDDVIFARRVVMGEIEIYMAEVDIYATQAEDTGEPANFKGGEAASLISAYLRAFAHLFPPGTDIWSEEAEAEDPTRVTLALPAVWENFPDFYARVNQVAQRAFDLSRMRPRDQAWIDAARELRADCYSCHAEYTRLPPPVAAEPGEGVVLPLPPPEIVP